MWDPVEEPHRPAGLYIGPIQDQQHLPPPRTGPNERGHNSGGPPRSAADPLKVRLGATCCDCCYSLSLTDSAEAIFSVPLRIAVL